MRLRNKQEHGGNEGFQFLSYEHAFKSGLKAGRGGRKPRFSYKPPHSHITSGYLLSPLTMPHQPGRVGDAAMPPNTDTLNMTRSLKDLPS